MTAAWLLRLAVVALGAYSLGARDWRGVVGATIALLAVELGVITHGTQARRERDAWESRYRGTLGE